MGKDRDLESMAWESQLQLQGCCSPLWAPAACGLENKNKRDAWWREDLVESRG